MASWAALLALTGFHYSAVDRTMAFASHEGSWFWSNGYTWVTCRQQFGADGVQKELTVLHGSLTLERFALAGVGELAFDSPRTIRPGKSLSLLVKP